MITKIEAVNYRSLRYVSQEVAPFQVLIGPNASGKSTFMDIISLISDIINKPNIKEVVSSRSRVGDFRDLLWMHESEWFELAIEVEVPEKLQSSYRSLRYAVRVGLNETISILRENLWLIKQPPFQIESHSLTQPIPDVIPSEAALLITSGLSSIVGKTDQGITIFHSENDDEPEIMRLSGSKTTVRSILSYTPDKDQYPVTTWFTEYISNQVQKIALDSEKLRQGSPSQDSREALAENGSNLPRVVQRLKDQYPDQFQDWLAHIQTALPDIKDIITFERPEDHQRYLIVEYNTGLKIPSWVVSDGTLRLLALTIIAYLQDFEDIYLIEEPENGIHPLGIETVYQSLRYVYDSQVLIATHSPVVLNIAEPSELLCFTKTEQKGTGIIRGDLHPRLAEWRKEVSLGTLFASGVFE